MTPSTIDTIRTLGYEIGVAHGSVEVEQDALAAAQDAAGVTAITAAADTITTATVQDLSNAGKLPAASADRQALVAQIASAALDLVQQAADDKVAFHERALAAAQEMPDVWRIEQVANGQTVLSVLVACKADGTGWDDGAQAQLDALADQAAYNERAYQALHHHGSTAPADDPAVLACPICNPPAAAA